MRIGIVIVGIVLLVIGAVLMFVPVAAQSAQNVDTSSSSPYAVLSVSGFSLTGNIPVSVSWTASGTVEVISAACSASCDTGNASAISGVTIQTGTSGSFTLNQPDGGEILVGAINPSLSGAGQNVTFNITTALTSVGTILLFVGIVILIVGVVLRGKPKAAPMDSTMAAPAQGSPNPPPPSQ